MAVKSVTIHSRIQMKKYFLTDKPDEVFSSSESGLRTGTEKQLRLT